MSFLNSNSLASVLVAEIAVAVLFQAAFLTRLTVGKVRDEHREV